jgi:hypothetical protein
MRAKCGQGRSVGAFAALAVAVAVFNSPAMAAQKCQVGDKAVEKAGGYANAVRAAVQDAPTCEAAYSVLEACQLGSSGDNALDDIVQSKCTILFMNKTNLTTRKTYQAALHHCDQIAVKNEGTMYQGFAAVCRAKAARDFARTYSRPPHQHIQRTQ